MKESFQKKYNDSINLISHLILTKPTPVIGLLAKYGVAFTSTPSKKQLINEIVELLKSNDPKFEDDFGKLLIVHIQYKGKEMLALERNEFSSYDDGDEDEFWGAIAKGAIGIVGGLFKKKKRRRSKGGGGNSAALLASQASSRQQAAQAKRDMQMQMQRMQEAAERRRIEESERRRREETERRRREETAKKEVEAKRKQTNMMLLAGGGIALLAIIGVVMSKSNSSIQSMTAQPISGR